MAKDVAQRELDLATFRISNLGAPTKVGDATRVDPTFVPLASAGSGTPGESFEAAAKDHVHPAVPGQGGPLPISRNAPGVQSALQLDTNVHEILFEDRIDFTPFAGTHLITATLRADIRRDGVADGGPGGRLILAFDAADDDPNSGTYCANLTSDSDTLATLTNSVDIPLPQPSSLVRIIATGGVFAKNKSISFTVKE